MTNWLKRFKQQGFCITAIVLMLAAVWQAYSPYVFKKDDISTAREQLRFLSSSELTAMVEENNRPTLLVVWASWCAACRAYDADLLKLAKAGKFGDAQVILLSADANKEDMLRQFVLSKLHENFMPYILEGKLDKFYQRVGSMTTGHLPQTMVFRADGWLLYESNSISGEDQQKMLSHLQANN